MKFETMPDEELTRWAKHQSAYLRELIHFCKYNDKKEIAFLAIKSPHIYPETLIDLMRQGKEAILHPKSHKTLEGDWWQFTEGIKNPMIPIFAQNPTYGNELTRICGCHVLDYLRVENLSRSQQEAFRLGVKGSPSVARQMAPEEPASIREAFAKVLAPKKKVHWSETKEWIESGW